MEHASQSEPPVDSPSASPSLKAQVRSHWEQETCGTRYGTSKERKSYFDEIADFRYSFEPFIPEFARFHEAKNKRVLEIGVGAGSDFLNWTRHAEHATGVDLTDAAIRLTDENLRLHDIPPSKYTLQRADAENLNLPSESFDIVYSWGVLHHSPETVQALKEVFRVLKPGGHTKIMVYHVHSWTAWMLYALYGPLRGHFSMTPRKAVYKHLESPGTKAYDLSEARRMLEGIGFTNVQLSTRLSPGDLLEIKPSGKYQSGIHRMIWKFYPRSLVRAIGHRFGLYLLMEGTK